MSSRFEGHYVVFFTSFAVEGAHEWLRLQIRIALQDRQQQYRALPYELLWAMKLSPLLICPFLVASVSLSPYVSAVQVVGGPFETLHKSSANVKPHVVQKRANGKVQAAYFSNW